MERSDIRDPAFRHSASLRAFTPVFDGLWTRVNALMAQCGLEAWVPATGSPRRERRGVPLAGTNGCWRRSERDWRAHEIALAELDPALAQDVVGGGAVEIEIRQRVGEQQRLAGELARRSARERDLDR